MNYELAKQLKDAGFPQNESRFFEGFNVERSDKSVSIPTLSELIDAFQSRYKYIDGLINNAQFVLRKTFSGNEKAYIAYLDGEWEGYDIESKYRFISTHAEEATANLWLALNKK